MSGCHIPCHRGPPKLAFQVFQNVLTKSHIQKNLHPDIGYFQFAPAQARTGNNQCRGADFFGYETLSKRSKTLEKQVLEVPYDRVYGIPTLGFSGLRLLLYLKLFVFFMSSMQGWGEVIVSIRTQEIVYLKLCYEFGRVICRALTTNRQNATVC